MKEIIKDFAGGIHPAYFTREDVIRILQSYVDKPHKDSLELKLISLIESYKADIEDMQDDEDIEVQAEVETLVSVVLSLEKLLQ